MKTVFIWRLLEAVFVVVFNAVFFLSDIEPRNSTVWIAYVFIHISYFFLILTPKFITKSKNSHVFGMTLTALSFTYFVMMLIIGVFFISMRFENWKISFFIQLILTGFYVISLATNLLMDTHTAAIENRSMTEIQFLKTEISNLLVIINKISDSHKKKKIEKVCDALRSSPTKSHSSVADIEKKISNEIQNIGISTNDDAEFVKHLTVLHELIAKRNETLKLLN